MFALCSFIIISTVSVYGVLGKTLYAEAKEKGILYVDGHFIADWEWLIGQMKVDIFGEPSVIAISGETSGWDAGIMAAFGDVVTTSTDWKCSSDASLQLTTEWTQPDFDDSTWSLASFSISDLGFPVPNMPAEAEVIWSGMPVINQMAFCRIKLGAAEPADVQQLQYIKEDGVLGAGNLSAEFSSISLQECSVACATQGRCMCTSYHYDGDTDPLTCFPQSPRGCCAFQYNANTSQCRLFASHKTQLAGASTGWTLFRTTH